MTSPHHDLLTCVEMLLESLLQSRKSGDETPTTSKANTYLYERLMNYLVMRRTEPLTDTHCFMLPADRPLSEAGWYYKTLAGGNTNWTGPFPTRKASIEARGKLKGQPRTSYQVLERELFGEVISTEEDLRCP